VPIDSQLRNDPPPAYVGLTLTLVLPRLERASFAAAQREWKESLRAQGPSACTTSHQGSEVPSQHLGRAEWRVAGAQKPRDLRWGWTARHTWPSVRQFRGGRTYLPRWALTGKAPLAQHAISVAGSTHRCIPAPRETAEPAKPAAWPRALAQAARLDRELELDGPSRYI
jgi:hypothetical protein